MLVLALVLVAAALLLAPVASVVGVGRARRRGVVAGSGGRDGAGVVGGIGCGRGVGNSGGGGRQDRRNHSRLLQLQLRPPLPRQHRWRLRRR